MDANEGARGVEASGVYGRDSGDDVVLLMTGARWTARALSGAARDELGEILSRRENSSGSAMTCGETLETMLLG